MLLSLLHDSLSVVMPVNSPIEDGAQVRDDLHLLIVDDTYRTLQHTYGTYTTEEEEKEPYELTSRHIPIIHITYTADTTAGSI